MRPAQDRGASPRGATSGLGPFPWERLQAAQARWTALLPPLRESVAALPGSDPWRAAVLARGEALAGALRAADRAGATAAAARLGGLGEGSTPAGDDYLMGVLHALWALDVPARAWAGALARGAAARTTAASAAWLRAAGDGAVGERWRGLLLALAGGDALAVAAAAGRVRSLGHTSGAFSLRGFLSVVPSRGPSRL